MSQSMHAKLVPYSSVVGHSITLHSGPDQPTIAQLAVLVPSGPPPGEDHKSFSERIAKLVIAAINSQ